MEAGDIMRLSFMAKLAEQAERFPDMCNFMKQVIAARKNILDEEERRLFSVAFKGSIEGYRRTMRIARAVKIAHASRKDSRGEKLAAECIAQAGHNILLVCKDMDGLLSLLLKATPDQDRHTKVMYIKMSADWSRYRCEVDGTALRQTLELYERAYRVSAELPEQSSLRLGVALNYAVFRGEIEGAVAEALKIARTALGNVDEAQSTSQSRDSFLIRQLLKDNVSIWSADLAADNDSLGHPTNVQAPVITA